MDTKVVFMFVVMASLTAPTEPLPQGWTWGRVRSYLRRYGYWRGATADDSPEGSEDDRRRLTDFQRRWGIRESGAISDDTAKMMDMPRCGVPDDFGPLSARRRKRFSIAGRAWRQRDLTYRVVNSDDSGINLEQTRRIMKRALEVWSDVTPLRFREVTSRADIDIVFYPPNQIHNSRDREVFDGPGGTLAHAFFPAAGGDAHFDQGELFTNGTRNGINLFQVAAHEFGHSLGLGHSDVATALMAPFFRGFQPNFQLDRDDIAGIQSLYGRNDRPTDGPTIRPTIRPTPSPATRTPGPTIIPGPDVCRNIRFDAVISHRLGTYVFRGTQYLKLNAIGIEPNDPPYPLRIRDAFPGATQVDAAIALDVRIRTSTGTRSVAAAFLFQGSRIRGYALATMQLFYDSGSPNNQFELFVGLPDRIDAIFRWTGNNDIYAIVGDEFYRLDSSLRVVSGYPRSRDLWNLPIERVDAAVQWISPDPRFRRTFFFSGSQYYRYNDINLRVDDGYPKSIATQWLNCDGGDGNGDDDNDRDGDGDGDGDGGGDSDGDGDGSANGSCKTSGYLGHYLYMLSLTWTLVIANLARL